MDSQKRDKQNRLDHLMREKLYLAKMLKIMQFREQGLKQHLLKLINEKNFIINENLNLKLEKVSINGENKVLENRSIESNVKLEVYRVQLIEMIKNQKTSQQSLSDLMYDFNSSSSTLETILNQSILKMSLGNSEKEYYTRDSSNSTSDLIQMNNISSMTDNQNFMNSKEKITLNK